MPKQRRDPSPLSPLRLALALSGLALCGRSFAHAQSAFEFDAPCIDKDGFAKRVEQLLPPGESPDSVLSDGSIRVSAQGQGFALHLELPARDGLAADSRDLREASCDSLVDAAAIVVSLRWQEQRRLALEAASKPTASPEPEPEPEPPRSTSALRIALAAGATAGTGLLPGLSLGVDLGAGLEIDAIRVMLQGRAWPAKTERVSGDRGPGGRASLLEISPSVAWLALRVDAFAFGPQLAVAIGRLAATGVGISDRHDDQTWLVRTDADACAHFAPAGLPFAVFAAAGAAVPWSRPRLNIAGRGDIYRLKAVGFRAAIALEVHLD
jgi:hypothetical protein